MFGGTWLQCHRVFSSAHTDGNDLTPISLGNAELQISSLTSSVKVILLIDPGTSVLQSNVPRPVIQVLRCCIFTVHCCWVIGSGPEAQASLYAYWLTEAGIHHSYILYTYLSWQITPKSVVQH